MTRYFVAPDGYGDLWLWREELGREHAPEPLVWQRSLDRYLWDRLTEGMEHR